MIADAREGLREALVSALMRRRELMHPYWEELKEYVETELGEAFRPDMMGGWDALVDDEFARYEDPVDFYKKSRVYLYHLTAFGLDMYKPPVYEKLVEALLPHERGGTVLDYGCGIGTDGLRLHDQLGFAPSFADFETECAKYLRWRLARRGLDAPVYDIEEDEIPRHDLLVSFDVVEHVDPGEMEGYVAAVCRLGRIAAVNAPTGPSRSAAHHEVDVGALEGMFTDAGATVRRHVVTNAFIHLWVLDTPEPPPAVRKRGPAVRREPEPAPEETDGPDAPPATDLEEDER